MLDDKPLCINGATPEKDTKQVPGGLCLMGVIIISRYFNIRPRAA